MIGIASLRVFERLVHVGVLFLLALTSAANAEEAWIRVNQIGYLPGDPKIAVLSSDEPHERRVSGRRVRGRRRRRSGRLGAVRAQLSARLQRR